MTFQPFYPSQQEPSVSYQPYNENQTNTNWSNNMNTNNNFYNGGTSNNARNTFTRQTPPWCGFCHPDLASRLVHFSQRIPFQRYATGFCYCDTSRINNTATADCGELTAPHIIHAPGEPLDSVIYNEFGFVLDPTDGSETITSPFFCWLLFVKTNKDARKSDMQLTAEDIQAVVRLLTNTIPFHASAVLCVTCQGIYIFRFDHVSSNTMSSLRAGGNEDCAIEFAAHFNVFTSHTHMSNNDLLRFLQKTDFLSLNIRFVPLSRLVKHGFDLRSARERDAMSFDESSDASSCSSYSTWSATNSVQPYENNSMNMFPPTDASSFDQGQTSSPRSNQSFSCQKQQQAPPPQWDKSFSNLSAIFSSVPATTTSMSSTASACLPISIINSQFQQQQPNKRNGMNIYQNQNQQASYRQVGFQPPQQLQQGQSFQQQGQQQQQLYSKPSSFSNFSQQRSTIGCDIKQQPPQQQQRQFQSLNTCTSSSGVLQQQQQQPPLPQQQQPIYNAINHYHIDEVVNRPLLVWILQQMYGRQKSMQELQTLYDDFLLLVEITTPIVRARNSLVLAYREFIQENSAMEERPLLKTVLQNLFPEKDALALDVLEMQFIMLRDIFNTSIYSTDPMVLDYRHYIENLLVSSAATTTEKP